MSTRKTGLSRPRMGRGRVHVPKKESESILTQDDMKTEGRVDLDYIEPQPKQAEISDAGERKKSKQKVDWDNIGAGFKKAGKAIKDTASAGMKGASGAASAYGDWYEKKADKNRERSLRQAKARVEYEAQYEPLRDELLENRESRLKDQAKLQELEYREEKEQIRRDSAQRRLDLERQEQEIEYQERMQKQQERLARLEDRRLRSVGVVPQPRQQIRVPQSRPQNGGFQPVQNMRAPQQPQRRMNSMDFMNMSMGNQSMGRPVSRQNQNINPPRRMSSMDFMGSVSNVMGGQNTFQSQPQPQFQQPVALSPSRSSQNQSRSLPHAPVSHSRRTSKKSGGRASADDYDEYGEDYDDDYDYDDYDYDDYDDGAVPRVARKRTPAKKSPPKKKSVKKTPARKKPVRRVSSTRR